jgi:radical SAM protein with 4Fe4S-binding SPASM domain
MDLPIGNIMRDNFRQLWAESSVLVSLRNRRYYDGNCPTCRYWAVCRGCRAIALASARNNGEEDYLSPDPQCSHYRPVDVSEEVVKKNGEPGRSRNRSRYRRRVRGGAAKKNTGSVGIIEKGKVEGECIFHACILTKAPGHAARTYKKMKTADFFGLPVLTENADYKKVKAFKDSIIDDTSEGLDDELTEAGIKLFRGDARFIFPIEVAVGDEIITAKKSLSPPVHCRPHPRYRVWQKQVISRTSKRLNWKKYRSDWLLSAAAPSGWSSPRRT